MIPYSLARLRVEPTSIADERGVRAWGSIDAIDDDVILYWEMPELSMVFETLPCPSIPLWNETHCAI